MLLGIAMSDLKVIAIIDLRESMSLTDELNKPEYQTGTYVERLTLLKSKTVPAIGRIEQGQLKVLEAIIAAGLWRDKMERIKAEGNSTIANSGATASEKQLAKIKLQVVAGFHEAISEAKLANKAPADQGGHSVNLSDDAVQMTFTAAQMEGIQLITPAEVAQVMALATYQKQLFPNAILHDVIAHFEPDLVNVGEWIEVGNVASSRIQLRITEPVPEDEAVRIEMAESDDGIDWTEFKRVNHFYGVKGKGFYFANIPNNGLQRKIRVRGERYRITGTVKAV